MTNENFSVEVCRTRSQRTERAPDNTSGWCWWLWEKETIEEMFDSDQRWARSGVAKDLEGRNRFFSFLAGSTKYEYIFF